MKNISSNQLDFINNFWLQLGDTSKLDLRGPLKDGIFKSEDEEIPSVLLDVMTNPNYLSFVAKEIMNTEMLPFQGLIMKELWLRPFPMLIATRGCGKTFILALYGMLRAFLQQGVRIVLVGSAFRQSKLIFEYMAEIWNRSPLLRDICGTGREQGPKFDIDRCVMTIGTSKIVAIPLGDGCLAGNTLLTYEDGIRYITSEHCKENISKNIIKRNIGIYGNGNFNLSDEAYCNGLKPVKCITTKLGYNFKSTFNHRMKILRNNKIVWCRADDLIIGDKILIDINERWFKNTNNVCKEQAYALGLMIGDGCYTSKYCLGFATKDNEFIDALNIGMDLKWKQCSDKVHWKVFGIDNVNNWLDFWDIEATYTKDKILPEKLLSASKEAVSSCLSGIFDTDATINIGKKDGGTGVTISLTNTSRELIHQIQYVLTHFGIVSRIKSRNRNPRWNTVYELFITGQDVIKFNDLIGFKLHRKNKKLNDALSAKKRFPKRINQTDNYYIDTVVSINDSEDITYDVHIPETHEYCANAFFSHNTKIRGLRANYIICDEFASVKKDVFENVVRGFAAVSANPVEAVKAEYRERAKRFLNIGEEPKESEIYMGNQTILSGTAYFGFNHFHDYWQRNKKIINSRGDTRKLEQLFPDGIDKNFDYRDYSIIRLPYNLLPDKFMDMKQIAHARANIHKAYFNMEYGAIFAKDTDGFYKRSVIEKCVANEENNIIMPITGLAKFSVTNRGKQNSKYVIGIDPASERDNFSIIVLELLADHVRIVHCWTSTRKVHSEYIKAGLTQENDFYSFCARKIRDLRTIFPCDCIGIDGQGGGVAIEEALKDKDKIKANEAMILPAIDSNKSKPTDDLSGEHILHVFQAADSEWLSTANHNLRKDLEDRLLLFPEFDTVALGFAIEDDKLSQRKYDTLEDCMLEIEELKDELASIVHGSTNAGRDTFTTPEERLPGGKKGRQRKDRYSALLIANYLARNISRAKPKVEYEPYGGFVGTLGKSDGGSPKFSGPDWFVQGAKKYY